LDWNSYQQGALTTAVFPPERSVDYTIFGLVSEIAELVEVKNGDFISWDARKADYLKELGDCFWYAAAVADALETNLNSVSPGVVVERHWPEIPGLMEALIIDAGFLAGLAKKAIRDDDGFIGLERKGLMLLRVENILRSLSGIAYALGSSPEAVTASNLNKLADRKARGVLQGSGDNR
jgi:hypothetical protein